MGKRKRTKAERVYALLSDLPCPVRVGWDGKRWRAEYPEFWTIWRCDIERLLRVAIDKADITDRIRTTRRKFGLPEGGTRRG